MTENAPDESNYATAAAPAGRGFMSYVALAAVLVLVIGAVAYYLTSGEEEAPPQLPVAIGTPLANTGPIDPNRPKEGEVAPDFALPDARDPSKLVKLSDFRGKPVVVNFYYSTCAPCKREIPAFVEAENALGDSVIFLGVDYLEGPEEAVSILDKYGATYPAVLDGAGAVSEHYRVLGYPATFFLDADGVVRVIKTGEVTEAMLATFLGKAGVTYSP